MNTNRRNIVFLILVLNLSVSSCGPGGLFGPTLTPIPTVTQTPSPTLTPTPTPTFTPTFTPTVTPTTTPNLPVSLGTQIPSFGEVISTSNWSKLSEFARWGLGRITAQFRWSPDNRFIAIPTRFGVRLINAETGSLVLTLPNVTEGDFLSSEVFAGTNGQEIKLFRLSDGKVLQTIEVAGTELSVSLDKSRVAINENDNIIKLFDTQTWSQIQAITLPPVRSGGYTFTASILGISPNGSTIAIDHWGNHRTQFWSTETGTILKSFPADGVISADWTIFAAQDSQGDCTGVYKVNEKLDFSKINVKFGCNGTVILSPDGKKWSPGNGVFSFGEKQPVVLETSSQSDYFYFGTFSWDGNKIANRNEDDSVGMWDTNTGKLLFLLPNNFIISGSKLVFSPDGNLIASGGYYGVEIRNSQTGEAIASFNGGAGLFRRIKDLRFSPDGKYLLSNNMDLYRTDDWTIAKYYNLQDSPMAFSPDGKLMAFYSWRNVVILRQTEDNKTVAELQFSGQSPMCMDYSLDGNYLAVGTANGSVWLWKMPQRKLITILWTEARFIDHVLFSPDGKFLTTTTSEMHGNNPKFIVWRLSDNSKFLETNWISWGKDYGFSPDGSIFVAGSYHGVDAPEDGEYHFWRTDSWTELGTLRTPTGDAMTFSPDGRFFIIGGDIIVFYGIKP
jgi:WD40 repeat protein